MTTSEKEAWHDVLEKAHENAPCKGKRVVITRGRKHKGLQGIVIWHGQDKFYEARQRQYRVGVSDILHTTIGREGYRIGIKDDATETVIWVSAAHVDIIA